MRLFTFAVLVFSAVLTSCSNQGGSSKTKTRANIQTDIENDTVFSKSIPRKKYKGYLGDTPIQIIFKALSENLYDNKKLDTIEGHYIIGNQPNELKTKITAYRSEENARNGSSFYTFLELNDNGKTVARWSYMNGSSEGILQGSRVLEGFKKEQRVKVVAESSLVYMDSMSKVCFDSIESYHSFMDQNNILPANFQLDNGGFIFRNFKKGQANYFDSEGKPIPLLQEGIHIFEFAQGWQIYLREAGEIINNNRVLLDATSFGGTDTIGLFTNTFSIFELSEESFALGFESFYDAKFIQISSKNNGLFLSVDELNKKGFSVSTYDHWFIKNNSDLDYSLLGNFYIKDEPSQASKNIAQSSLLNANDDCRVFVIGSKGAWFHVQIKCTSNNEEIIEGWIPMYTKDKNDKKILTLNANSQGC